MNEKIGLKTHGFGIACTCTWTMLHQAMKADGMDVPEKCGQATRDMIVNLVRESFTAIDSEMALLKLLRECEPAILAWAAEGEVRRSEGDKFHLTLGPNHYKAGELLDRVQQAIKGAPPASSGVALIAVERAEHVTREGWTRDHDAEHTDGSLAIAAAYYIAPTQMSGHWPWAPNWYKPGDRIRELTKAGALCAAEIDRLLAKEGK